MNKEAMLEIANLIEQANPKNFHMGSWFGELTMIDDMENDGWKEQLLEEVGLNPTDVVSVPIPYVDINEKNLLDIDFQNQFACNTTACIAGWTLFNEYIKNGTSFDHHVESRAAKILGLTSTQASYLFYCGYGSIWDQVADKYEFSYDRDETATWNFPNIMVADVLRKIVSGEFELSGGNDYEDEYEDSY